MQSQILETMPMPEKAEVTTPVVSRYRLSSSPDQEDDEFGNTTAFTPTTHGVSYEDLSSMQYSQSSPNVSLGTQGSPSNSSAHSEPAQDEGVHLRRLFSYDPYCVYTGVRLFCVCSCVDCVPTPPPYMSSQIDLVQEFPQGAPQSIDDTWPENQAMSSPTTPGFTPYPSRGIRTGAAPSYENAKQKLAQQKQREEEVERHEQPQLAFTNGICMNNTSTTSFMPPAPPLLSKCHLIFDQKDSTATPAQASAVICSMLVRWYGKIEACQHQFLDRCKHCPTMETYDSLEDWSVACMDWWTHHFSTRQMKYIPKKFKANPLAKAGLPAPRSQGGATGAPPPPPPPPMPANTTTSANPRPAPGPRTDVNHQNLSAAPIVGNKKKKVFNHNTNRSHHVSGPRSSAVPATQPARRKGVE